jgi:hypothetical protein
MTGPVILPCYQTVCAKHETHFNQSETSTAPATCKLCGQAHKLNVNQHFPTNTIALALLEKEVEDLDFGVDHKKALSSLDSLKSSISKLDEAQKSPDEMIVNYFHQTRTQVDLVREELIENITKCSEMIIDEINAYEQECKSNLPVLKKKIASNKMFELADIKAELKEWGVKVKRLFYDKDLYDSINAKYEDYLNTINKSMAAFSNEVYLDKVKSEDFESKYANLYDVFYKQCGFDRYNFKLFFMIFVYFDFNSGFKRDRKRKLEFRVHDLSKYRHIKGRKEFLSEVAFVDNMPLRITAYLTPDEKNKKVNLGVYLNACPVNEYLLKK